MGFAREIRSGIVNQAAVAQSTATEHFYLSTQGLLWYKARPAAGRVIYSIYLTPHTYRHSGLGASPLNKLRGWVDCWDAWRTNPIKEQSCPK